MRRALLGLTAFAALVGGTRGTQDAIANGDTRTLSFYHVHTKETASVTFRRSGSYDSRALAQLNHLLRDWRNDKTAAMDPRLFDIVWEVHRSVGSSEPVHINSAYRSPETNGMLRRRSRGVSKHSQHMNGKAMDFYMPDVDMARVRAVAMRLQQGGVGYYPSSYNSFVHLDSGSVRSWPRMTRDQLVRLFPNEKTVHLPRDGKPLAGYEEARAEILSRGGSVSGYAVADGGEDSGPRKSLWAMLFGGDDDGDAEYYQATSRGRSATRSQPQLASAYASSSQSDDGGRFPTVVAPEPAPAVSRRSREMQVAALPEAPQAGPAAAASSAETEAPAQPQLALAPMPPRRPDDMVALAALGFAPAPPSRPVSLAAAGVIPLSADASDARETASLSEGTPSGAAHPLPPARPTALARLDGPATTSAVPARDSGSATDDRAQLRALFAAVASDAAPVRTIRVAVARTKAQADAPSGLVAAPGAGLKLGFSSKPTDLGSTRFDGPAVKPLPVLR